MKKETDEHFLAGVIEHLAHPIFVKDREFRYIMVNRALLEIMGRVGDEENVVGKTDFELFVKEQAEAFRAQDEAMFATRLGPEVVEEKFTDAAGRNYVVQTTKVPLTDASGTITHLVGIIHDITDRKAAQEALRLANEQLENRVMERTLALQSAREGLTRRERLAELGKLAGGVAHEIRNPLTAIKNAAYVLERQLGKNTNADVQQALAIVHDEVARANHIVGELLDYARVREPERRRVQLADLISAALKASDVPTGVAIVQGSALVDVLVDATQVEAALSNVIRNSIEAMHGKGEITFETRSEADLVIVSVRDVGPGVPAEIEQHLFEPLVTTKASGLGLGLVTARTLIERQGGTLVYKSSLKPGACFEISLPRIA
jgi:PAS domain S-box-containing protein